MRPPAPRARDGEVMSHDLGAGPAPVPLTRGDVRAMRADVVPADVSERPGFVPGGESTPLSIGQAC